MKRGSGVAIDAFGVVTVEGFESVVSVVAAFRADTLGLVVNTDANNVELVAVDVVVAAVVVVTCVLFSDTFFSE